MSLAFQLKEVVFWTVVLFSLQKMEKENTMQFITNALSLDTNEKEQGRANNNVPCFNSVLITSTLLIIDDVCILTAMRIFDEESSSECLSHLYVHDEHHVKRGYILNQSTAPFNRFRETLRRRFESRRTGALLSTTS